MAVVVELDELALVDRSNTKLAFDGRNERRSLEQGAGEGLKGLSERGLASWDGVVKSDHAHVLLTSSLLSLDKPCGAIDADDWETRVRSGHAICYKGPEIRLGVTEQTYSGNR